MKLWIIRPIKNLPEEDDPWACQYGVCHGFVICAESEENARKIAHEGAWNENMKEITPIEYQEISPWMSEKYSSCKELNPTEKEEVVMSDVYLG